MKKIIYLASFLFCSCMALVSCQDDYEENIVTNGNAVRISFQTSDYTQLGTRATSESGLKDITVLQYKNGSLVKKLPILEDKLFSQAVELEGLEDLDASNLDSNGKLVQGNENVIVFLANIKAATGAETTLSEGSAYSALSTYMLSFANADDMAAIEYMPMKGFYYGGITSGITNQINVTLSRLMAKVSFTLNTANFKVGSGASAENPAITVNSITLHNVPKTITVFPTNRPALPANSLPGEWPSSPQTPYPSATKPGGSAHADGGYEASNFVTLGVDHNQTTSDKSFYFMAYMPENARGSYTIASNKDKMPKSITEANRTGLTYILVDLDYVTSTGITKNVTYRIYIGGDDKGDMNLLSNTQYNVTTYVYGDNNTDTRIEVTSLFDPTPSAGSNITVQDLANSYIINSSTVNSQKPGFTIPLAQARNGWRYIHSTLSATGDNTDYTLAFDNMVKGSWTIETLWKTWTGGSNITGVKTTSGEVSTPNNSANDFFAKLTIPTGLNGNNAVIALKDGSGNIWWTWHLWFTDYNPDAAAGSMNGQTHTYFSEAFTTAGLYYGKRMMDRNLGAMITGVQDGSGLPSNVADYNITSKQPQTAAEAAKWYGLMYQWGRKDPFTNSALTGTALNDIGGATPIYNSSDVRYSYANGAEAGKDMNNNTIYADAANGYSVDGFPKVSNGAAANYRVFDAVRNPMIYFHSGVSNDWTLQDNNLWQMTTKTPFDPCPPGWRVPAGGGTAANNPWSGFGDGLFNSPANKTYADIWGNNDSGPFPWFAQKGATQVLGWGTAGRTYGVTNDLGTKGFSGTAAWYGGNNSVAWYPASGYRNYTSGAFGAIGSPG